MERQPGSMNDLLQEQLARLRGSWSAENQQAAVTYTPVQRGTSAPEVSAKRMEPPKRPPPPPPPPPYQAPGEPLGKRPCLGSSCLTGSTTYHKPLVELGLQLEQRNAARHLVEQKQLWAPPPMKPPKLVQVLPNGIILPGLAPTLVYLPPPPAAPNTAFAVLPNGTTMACFPKSTPAASALVPAAPGAAPAAASSVLMSAGPPTFSMIRAPVGSSLKEMFVKHVMSRFTPMRPSQFQMSLWVSAGRLIDLLQPHAPKEVEQLGDKKLTQLIIEWYMDHPTYRSLLYRSWCKNLQERSYRRNPRIASSSVNATSVHFPLAARPHCAANLVSKPRPRTLMRTT